MSEQQAIASERYQTEKIRKTELVERFANHPFANLETYKYFNQTGEPARQAKETFVEAAMSGKTPVTVEFSYPKLNIYDLVAKRDELAELLQAVLELEMEDEENRLLREKVTDRLHEAGIMILTQLQSNLDTNDPMYAAVSYQLGENMREVYGQPETSHWRGILGYRLSLLSEIENRQNVPNVVREAWAFVRDSLPADLPIVEPYSPKPETQVWYRQQLEERLAPARQAVQEAIDSGEVELNQDGKLDAKNIVKATRIALAARKAEGWTVEETEESNVDTSQEKKGIYIPLTRLMTLEQFDSVIQAHEIDEHVMRRVNGDASGVVILGGTGCAGYLGWEEGNGKANEGLLKGQVNNKESAFNFYLSGGLALGIDNQGGGGRSFGQTFDLVWRMRYVDAFLAGKLSEGESMKQAIMDKTVDSLRRIFRGTDGHAPGVVFTKDVMTYYLGQVEVWRKWDQDMDLDEPTRIREHNLERSAKINPLRPDHRRVALGAFAVKY